MIEMESAAEKTKTLSEMLSKKAVLFIQVLIVLIIFVRFFPMQLVWFRFNTPLAKRFHVFFLQKNIFY